MLKTLVIGNGNCGNQVANVAANRGMDAIAINTCQGDLAAAPNVLQKYTIGEKSDDRGSGRDRATAKGYLRQGIQKLLNAESFTNSLETCEVCFIVSSTGGGTGSGISPLLYEILSSSYPDKYFVLVGVGPDASESFAAKTNLIEYAKEVRATIENAKYMLYKNTFDKNESPNVSLQKLNERIISDIEVLNGYVIRPTDKLSIDSSDLLNFFKTPGRIYVNSATFREKDIAGDLEDYLISKIESDPFNVGFERDGIVHRCGYIVDASENFINNVDIGIPKIEKIFGVTGDKSTHIVVSDDSVNFVGLVVSGLSYPDEYIQIMMQDIEDTVSTFKHSKQSILEDDSISTLIESARSIVSQKSDDVEDQVIDVAAVFNKF